MSISYYSKYNSLINEFENTAMSKEFLLREHIRMSSNFIKSMMIHGNTFFENGSGSDSEFYSLLKYNPKANSYNMDSAKGTTQENELGNITGLGKIPEAGEVRDELNLALQYNKFFSSYYEKFPDVAWLYYTSENNFINMYPWISSKDFTFSEKLKTVEFYKIANPLHNPFRKIVWTPAYIDEAGKGTMITLSAPIYDKDNFKGVISLDLTTTWLANIIASDYEGYLIEDTNSILSVSHSRISNDSDSELKALMKIPAKDFEELKKLKLSEVQILDGCYIYLASFSEAPWKLFYIVPVWQIAGKAAASVLPILLISVFLIISMNQIEKRKKSEALLKREKELLETTFFSIAEGIIVTDKSGRITLMNAIAEKYTGWTKEEACGMEFHEVYNNINIETRERRYNPVAHVLETGKNIRSDRYIGLISRDGSESYILGSAAGIISDAGELSGVVVSFRDITKEYEQEREIAGFLNINLDMLCVVDTGGKFHKANKRFEEMLGYRTEEMEGKSVLSLVHEEDKTLMLNAHRELLEKKAVSAFTARCRCKDGSYRYIEWHAQIGSGKYIYSSARDVTDKRMLEERLRTSATKDELTRLYNRNFFESIIKNKLEMADISDETISIALIDLDHFKQVNDTWGHPAGDELLKSTAQTIERNLRKSDILVRFGGEEFIVLMPNTSIDGAIAASEKIRFAIESCIHPTIGKQTASIGVAERLESEAFSNWYARVDEALYRAKHSGRNCVVAALETK